MANNSEPSDGLMHELIGLVRDNTEKTIAVRNDVNRAISQVYQDIVIIKRQLDAEAIERPQRQKQLDGSIKQINDRLDNQDGQQQKIIRSGRWRMWLMIGILAVCSFIALRVALAWVGALT